MKFGVICLIIFWLSGCSKSLVGQIVPPYPNSEFSQNGACITGHLGYARMCEYSVGLLQNSKEEFIAILAKKTTKKHEDDPNSWIVTDQLDYPEVKQGTWLVYGSCKQNDKFDQTILAVVIDTNTEFQKTTQWVWRVDLETGLFIKINSDNILCVNEGWGA